MTEPYQPRYLWRHRVHRPHPERAQRPDCWPVALGRVCPDTAREATEMVETYWDWCQTRMQGD